ncbi:hypothetical protein ACQKMN_08895 [Ureibacillus composti]
MDKSILKNFIEGSRFSAFRFVLEENTEKVHVFDNYGYEIEPEIAKNLIEGMTNTYVYMNELDRIKLQRDNADNEFRHHTHNYGPVSLESKFRTNLKRNWGFTCKACGKKVSSKNDVSWWRIDGAGYETDDKYCSKECIQPKVDELRENIKSRIYENFGVLSQLNEEIDF